MQTMKTIILVAFGLFFTATNAEIKLKLLENEVISSTFANSVLLSLPTCTSNKMNVDLQYNSTKTNDTKTLTIEVPSCSESKRDLISVTEKNKNFILSKFLGYQVTNLTNGTEYSFQYFAGADKSNVLLATTRTASSYTQINDGLAARSGAMVVITVILSVAMFILVLGLIITVFFVNNGE